MPFSPARGPQRRQCPKASIATLIALFALAGGMQALTAAPAGAATAEGTGSECKLYPNGYFDSLGRSCIPTEVISVTGVYEPPACFPGEVRCGLPTSIGGGSAYADKDGPKKDSSKAGGPKRAPAKKPEVKRPDSKKAKEAAMKEVECRILRDSIKDRENRPSGEQSKVDFWVAALRKATQDRVSLEADLERVQASPRRTARQDEENFIVSQIQTKKRLIAGLEDLLADYLKDKAAFHDMGCQSVLNK
jgi:hypothetical protein